MAGLDRGESLPMIFTLPGLRVACVDDHHDSADSTAMVLQAYGCETGVYYEGASALAAVSAFRPDVCLIDLSMPGMGGCELARRLRAWARKRPLYLVAVTARGSDVARQETAAAGFDLHLVKPINWDSLAEVLAEAERRLGRAANVAHHLTVPGSDRRRIPPVPPASRPNVKGVNVKGVSDVLRESPRRVERDRRA